VKILCNLADTVHTMMRNRDSTHTIDTVTKTYTLMQDLRVNHLMRMQDRLTTNMTIALGATTIGSAGRAPDDIFT
jgi:hypothetical protein